MVRRFLASLLVLSITVSPSLATAGAYPSSYKPAQLLAPQALNLPGTVYWSKEHKEGKETLSKLGGAASRMTVESGRDVSIFPQSWRTAVAGMVLVATLLVTAPLRLHGQSADARKDATTEIEAPLDKAGAAMAAPDAYASIFLAGMQAINASLTPQTLATTRFSVATRTKIGEGLANATRAPANSDSVRIQSTTLLARLIDAGFFNDFVPAQNANPSVPNVIDRFVDNALKIASDGFPTARARAFDILLALAQPRTVHLIYNRLPMLEKALPAVPGLTGGLTARPKQVLEALHRPDVQSRVAQIRAQGGVKQLSAESAAPASPAPPAGVVKPLEPGAIVNTFKGILSVWSSYFAAAQLPENLPRGIDRLSLFGFAYRGGQLVMGTEPRHEQEFERKAADWRKRARGKPFVITIVNDDLDSKDGGKDPALLRKLLATPATRDAHVKQIAALVAKTGADGVEIDWERVPFDVRDAYTDFIKRLRGALPKEKLLYVVAESRRADTTTGNSAGIDYHAVAPYVTGLTIMLYYENYPGGPKSGPTTSKKYLEEVLAYVLAPSKRANGVTLPGVPKEKLGAALALTALDSPIDAQGKKSGMGAIIRGSDLGPLKAQAIEAGRTAEGLSYFRYRGVGGQLREVHWTDAKSLEILVAAAQAMGISNVALWTLEFGDEPVMYWINLKEPVKIGQVLLFMAPHEVPTLFILRPAASARTLAAA